MSDEHTIAIVSFEGALKREIKRLRSRFSLDEKLSEFSLRIRASGPVHSGDVELTFEVSDNNYSGIEVRGDSLSACVEEFERRRGWKERHAPKKLSYEALGPGDDTNPEF